MRRGGSLFRTRLGSRIAKENVVGSRWYSFSWERRHRQSRVGHVCITREELSCSVTPYLVADCRVTDSRISQTSCKSTSGTMFPSVCFCLFLSWHSVPSASAPGEVTFLGTSLPEMGQNATTHQHCFGFDIRWYSIHDICCHLAALLVTPRSVPRPQVRSRHVFV